MVQQFTNTPYQRVLNKCKQDVKGRIQNPLFQLSESGRVIPDVYREIILFPQRTELIYNKTDKNKESCTKDSAQHIHVAALCHLGARLYNNPCVSMCSATCKFTCICAKSAVSLHCILIGHRFLNCIYVCSKRKKKKNAVCCTQAPPWCEIG